MKPDKRVEEFAKELSADVRWSSGYGQYENGSKEQQAYIDGVTTAIGMMYIGLTGTPKSKGMLMEYHQDLMSEVVEKIGRLEECFGDFDNEDENEPLLLKCEVLSILTDNHPLTEAQTIIKSLSK